MTRPASAATGLPVQAVQAALDVLQETIACVDERGVIRAVNSTWLQFMQANAGQPQACGPGANYLEACDQARGPCAEEGSAVAAGLRAVLSGTLPEFSLEYPCHSPEQQRWYHLQVRPFMAETQRYAMVVHEDVSARKLSEIRTSDLEAEVARSVRTQTAELRRENKELDAFIGAVSHDLRAPVRHLQGFLDVLRRRAAERLTEDDRRTLDVLDSAATRLGSMIDELLVLSRASHTAMRVQAVRLDQVVQGAWANVWPETEGREITWVTGDLPVVYGDAELLRLAFENLLNNAIKYTAGRMSARIEVGSKEESEGWTVFVKDDGVGFDPRYTSRLFGAFQRLHHAREFQGVGLGLLNVKRIIERHGGEVWAEGHPGNGATFFLRLPKHKKQAGE